MPEVLGSSPAGASKGCQEEEAEAEERRGARGASVTPAIA